MKKFNLTLFFVLIVNLLFAQKENYIWYFGDSAGVDFNSGSPVALTNGLMVATEGCSTISDSIGNLLFYTDGSMVWDKTHNLMPNGTGLAGNYSSTQSALIVPFPNSNSMYYIFTTGSWWTNPGFNYSVVDMNLNGGNGDITIKNFLLLSSSTERLSGVKHSNNTDVWVMVQELNNTNLDAFLITSSGVSTPVTSSIGAITNNLDAQGYMKFSPDGSKLAYATSLSSYVDLFDFNNSTGVVSNIKHLPVTTVSGTRAYGLEFSPSGNYLYCSSFDVPNKAIYQWDITSNSEPIINATIDSIGTTSDQQLDALQLGPDGKIYAAKSESNYLGVITNPDMPGLACNYIDNAFYLSGKLSSLGLPNFIASYFLSTGISSIELQQSQITAFPNPFTSNITISIQKEILRQATFSVKNTLGQTLLLKTENDRRNNYTETIELGFLPKGIYLLEANIDGERIIKKIVKE